MSHRGFEKKCTYSIRKYAVGSCSVMIGALLFGNHLVKADEVQIVADSQETLIRGASLVNESETRVVDTTLVRSLSTVDSDERESSGESLSVEKEKSQQENTDEIHPDEEWNFETSIENQKLKGIHQTDAEIYGNHISIVQEDQVFGKVLEFGEGTDNYLKIKNETNLAEQNVSYALWMKYNSAIKNTKEYASAVILQQDGAGRTILDRKADGKLNSYVDTVNHDSKVIIPADKWVHVAYVINQTTKTGSYYINGELDTTFALGNGLVNQKTSLLLGSHKNPQSDNPHPMRGKIDDFQIYNKVLTGDEILQIYSKKGKTVLENEEWNPLLTKVKTTLVESESFNQSPEYLRLVQQYQENKDRSFKTIKELKDTIRSLESSLETFLNNKPIRLYVNEGKVLRQIDPKHIFGVNHRYAFNGYGSFDSQTGEMNPEFAKIYQDIHFGSIRFPGGTISNLFNWKTSIGDKENRKKQIHGFYNQGNQTGIMPNLGLLEFATFAEKMDSEIIYVYSLARGSVQDAADLIEFLNGEVGQNVNGGVDWAQVRSDLGHPSPFNVKFFEVGNEMNQNYEEGKSSQSYWTSFVPGKNHTQAYLEGGTAKFTKQYAVAEEDWNKITSVSDGKANLKRFMRYANGNPKLYLGQGKFENDKSFTAVKKNSVQVFVGDDKNQEEWTIVENLGESTAKDKHVQINYADGSVLFGDGIHGAIPTKGQQIYVSYEVEKEGFLSIAKAIKDTQIQLAQKRTSLPNAQVYAGFESADLIRRIDEKASNNLYDGVVVHPYSGGAIQTDDPLKFYDDVMKRSETTVLHKVNEVKKLLPEGKQVPISEFGIYYSTNPQLRTLTHALYIARNVIDFVKLGSPYIQKHTLIDWFSSGADALGPTQQAVIQAVPQEGADTKTGEGTFRYIVTPSAYVFKMLNGGFGKNIIDIQSEITPRSKVNYKTLSLLASKDEEGNIYLAMVNADAVKEQKLDLSNYKGRTVTLQKLSDEELNRENTLENPSRVGIETETISEFSGNYSLPAHSFVLMKIMAENSSDRPVDLSSVVHQITPDEGVKYLTEEKARLDIVKEPIYFRKIERENPELAKGTHQVVQTGKDGERTLFVEITLKDGQEVARQTKESFVSLESVDQIVEIGVKEVTPDKPTEPSQPDKPVDKPTEPSQPDKPIDQPTEPSQPDKPADKPTEPSQPDKPVDQPSEPSQPDKPADQPTNPSNAAQDLRILQDKETGVAVIGCPAELGDAVSLSVKRVLDQSLMDKIYDAYDIRLLDKDGKEVQPQGAVLVRLPIQAGKTAEQVYYVTPNKELKALTFTQAANYVEFAATHFSTYAVVYGQAKAPEKSSDQQIQPLSSPGNQGKQMESAPAAVQATSAKLAALKAEQSLPNTGESSNAHLIFLASLSLALSTLFYLKDKRR